MEDLIKRSTELMEGLFVAVEQQRARLGTDDPRTPLRPELSPRMVEEIEALSVELRRAWLRMRALGRNGEAVRSSSSPTAGVSTGNDAPSMPSEPQKSGGGEAPSTPAPEPTTLHVVDASSDSSTFDGVLASPSAVVSLSPVHASESIRGESLGRVLEGFKAWLRTQEIVEPVRFKYTNFVRWHVAMRLPIEEKDAKDGARTAVRMFETFAEQVLRLDAGAFVGCGCSERTLERLMRDVREIGWLLGLLRDASWSHPVRMRACIDDFETWLETRLAFTATGELSAMACSRIFRADLYAGVLSQRAAKIVRLFSVYLLDEVGWDFVARLPPPPLLPHLTREMPSVRNEAAASTSCGSSDVVVETVYLGPENETNGDGDDDDAPPSKRRRRTPSPAPSVSPSAALAPSNPTPEHRVEAPASEARPSETSRSASTTPEASMRKAPRRYKRRAIEHIQLVDREPLLAALVERFKTNGLDAFWTAMRDFKEWLVGRGASASCVNKYKRFARNHVLRRLPFGEDHVREGTWTGIEEFGRFLSEVQGWDPLGIFRRPSAVRSADANRETATGCEWVSDTVITAKLRDGANRLAEYYDRRPAELKRHIDRFRARCLERDLTPDTATHYATLLHRVLCDGEPRDVSNNKTRAALHRFFEFHRDAHDWDPSECDLSPTNPIASL